MPFRPKTQLAPYSCSWRRARSRPSTTPGAVWYQRTGLPVILRIWVYRVMRGLTRQLSETSNWVCSPWYWPYVVLSGVSGRQTMPMDPLKRR